MKILIVDDTTTARIFAKKCLTGIGFHDAEFIQAKHGLDALEKLEENRIKFGHEPLAVQVISGWSTYTELSYKEKFLQGLRKAGMPEFSGY